MIDKDDLFPFFPIACEVEAGVTYRWCSCGKSATPPFCDRQDCGDRCLEYKAEFTETLHFCNCKLSKNPPLCDGSHVQKLMAKSHTNG